MEQEKNWEEYTKEEQTTLLNHWVYYYGGIIMTLKDFEDFRVLSTTKQDEIFDHNISYLIEILKTLKIKYIVFEDIDRYQDVEIFEIRNNFVTKM